MSARRLTRALAALGLATLTLVVLSPLPAAAATARVTFSPGSADPDYATTFALRGGGFQAVKGGFGGVYIMFGTVKGTWQPSQGGVSGQNFVYVQDSEDKDNRGYQRFVSYENGGTLSAANGGIVHPDGSWATNLIVPGASFPAQGRDGGIEQINCLKVQCGIITVGAHGVVDPQNETFTPVRFAVPGQAPAPRATAPTPAPSSSAPVTTSPVTTSPVTTSPAIASTAPSSGGLVIGGGAPSSPAPTADPTLTPAASRTGSSSADSSSTTWWLAGGGLALLVGLAGGVALRRRRPHPTDDGTSS